MDAESNSANLDLSVKAYLAKSVVKVFLQKGLIPAKIRQIILYRYSYEE